LQHTDSWVGAQAQAAPSAPAGDFATSDVYCAREDLLSE
jgi:hypothetical protein